MYMYSLNEIIRLLDSYFLMNLNYLRQYTRKQDIVFSIPILYY